MENESKRKNIVTIAIGVFIMLVLVVGSTYAFFQITSDETGNSASSFTGELEDIENYGNSFLRGGLTGYHIMINASDMAPSKIGTHYYGTTDENNDYNLKRMNYEVSEVSIEGGKNNYNVEYTCTSELSITLNGSLTEGNVLQEGDGALYLSGSNIRLDQRKIDLTELIKSATQNEEGIKEYKKTLTYIISKGNNGTLNVDFEIVNRNAIQNDIAGKKLDITIKNSNLHCEVSGKKVYANLNSSNTYRSSEYKDKIVSTSFVNYIPEDLEGEEIVTYWDLSISENNSVIGWLEVTEENPEQYNLYIGSKDKIYATYLYSAFEEMTNLKEIKFNNLNTSETTYMGRMFYNYKGTSLDLSNFDTSKVTDMSFMFADTSANITFPQGFGLATTGMSRMFYNYNGDTLDLSSFDTSKVTNMSYMFDGCSNLTTLDLSSFDTSSVTNMSNMFASGFQRSVSVNLPFKDWPNFVTTNVENMSSMFQGYAGTALDLSNFDTSKVTNMSSMFNSYAGTELDLTGFDTSSVEDMGLMFSNCTKLTTLDLSSFTFDNVTEGTDYNAGNYRTFYNVPSSCQVKINKSQLGTFNKLFPLGTGTYDRKFPVK